MSFVLDNSITMSWCFPDEVSSYTDRVFESARDSGAVAPAIWPFEVANAVWVGERTGRIVAAFVPRFGELLQSLAIEIEDVDLRRMLDTVRPIARDYKLSAYDASYLELAMRRGLPLATQDRRLAEAASRASVTLFS